MMNLNEARAAVTTAKAAFEQDQDGRVLAGLLFALLEAAGAAYLEGEYELAKGYLREAATAFEHIRLGTWTGLERGQTKAGLTVLSEAGENGQAHAAEYRASGDAQDALAAACYFGQAASDAWAAGNIGHAHNYAQSAQNLRMALG